MPLGTILFIKLPLVGKVNFRFHSVLSTSNPTPDTKEAVWSALESLASAPSNQRTLTGLSALLQDGELRQALKPFTLDGAYGHILDGDSDQISNNKTQAFEMEELMHSKGLVAPV